MAEPEKTGIVLAPYGTLSPPALATYQVIVRSYEKEFLRHPVRLAFTSRLMKKRLQEREGICVPSLKEALQELQDQDCDGAVVQSLQIVPGEEFHQIVKQVRSWGPGSSPGLLRLEAGLPLLSSPSDCRSVSSLLPAIIRQARGADTASEQEGKASGEAVLLAGHGTGHPADALYCLLSRILEKEHGNVFLGTIEGSLSLEDLLPDLRASGARRILLIPFMLVAGGHAERDIFGADSRSWKSILEGEGFAVLPHQRGLGGHPEMLSIFIEHTRKALEKNTKL